MIHATASNASPADAGIYSMDRSSSIVLPLGWGQQQQARFSQQQQPSPAPWAREPEEATPQLQRLTISASVPSHSPTGTMIMSMVPQDYVRSPSWGISHAESTQLATACSTPSSSSRNSPLPTMVSPHMISMQASEAVAAAIPEIHRSPSPTSFYTSEAHGAYDPHAAPIIRTPGEDATWAVHGNSCATPVRGCAEGATEMLESWRSRSPQQASPTGTVPQEQVSSPAYTETSSPFATVPQSHTWPGWCKAHLDRSLQNSDEWFVWIVQQGQLCQREKHWEKALVHYRQALQMRKLSSTKSKKDVPFHIQALIGDVLFDIGVIHMTLLLQQEQDKDAAGTVGMPLLSPPSQPIMTPADVGHPDATASANIAMSPGGSALEQTDLETPASSYEDDDGGDTNAVAADDDETNYEAMDIDDSESNCDDDAGAINGEQEEDQDEDNDDSYWEENENYEKCLQALHLCLDVRRACFGSNHPAVASALFKLAVVYAFQHDYPASLEFLLESLSILLAATGGSTQEPSSQEQDQASQQHAQDHTKAQHFQNLAAVWRALGQVHLAMGNVDDAKSSFEEANLCSNMSSNPREHALSA